MKTQDTKSEETATLVKHAIDLERELTEEDYATNSDALQQCAQAWGAVRAAHGTGEQGKP